MKTQTQEHIDRLNKDIESLTLELRHMDAASFKDREPISKLIDWNHAKIEELSKGE